MEKNNKTKWREGTLIFAFDLKDIKNHYTPLMEALVNVPPIQLTDAEQVFF